MNVRTLVTAWIASLLSTSCGGAGEPFDIQDAVLTGAVLDDILATVERSGGDECERACQEALSEKTGSFIQITEVRTCSLHIDPAYVRDTSPDAYDTASARPGGTVDCSGTALRNVRT
jgi:hypothetical protein